MGADALREVVKKIFGDEDTKTRFMQDPGSVLAQFSLTEQEEKSIMNVFSRAKLVTGGSPQLGAVLQAYDLWL